MQRRACHKISLFQTPLDIARYSYISSKENALHYAHADAHV